MSNKLFVGGLSWNTTEASLSEAFQPFGTVVEATIILDRATGRSRGFGFVGLSSSEEVKRAIEGMDGKELDGRRIRVSEAQDRPRPSGGGGQRFGHGPRSSGDRGPPRGNSDDFRGRDFGDRRDRGQSDRPSRDHSRREGGGGSRRDRDQRRNNRRDRDDGFGNEGRPPRERSFRGGRSREFDDMDDDPIDTRGGRRRRDDHHSSRSDDDLTDHDH